MSTDVVAEGERLIKNWKAAQERLARAKSEVIGAECDVANSTNELGKWLTPKDAKVNEKFCVWYGDSLIEAEALAHGDYKISVRSNGRALQRL